VDSNSPIFGMALIFGFIAGMGSMAVFLAYQRRRRRERQAALVVALLNGVQNGTVESLKDAESFYNAFFDRSQPGFRGFEELGLALRKVQVAASSQGPTESKPKFDRVLSTVRGLLDEHDRQMHEYLKELPFAGTPSPERELLQDIAALVGTGHDLLEAKLGELAKAVRIRQETLERLSDEKGRSLVWARWGVIGTVAFSAVSITLAIWGLARG
jgi:hypothetical protein